MVAKRVRLSDDAGSSWYTLPGSSAELRNEAGEIPDTVFGQVFASAEVGLIEGMITSNALYKGFAGYHADIRQCATSGTSMTGEAMSLETGKIYVIDDTTKNFWDRTATFVVLDNAVDHTADVEWIDFLFGRVKFLDAYTVTGPVTVTGEYLAATTVAKGRSFTLTQSMEPVDDTDFATAQANDGHRTYDYGLKTVTLELGGIYAAANGWYAALEARSEILIEIAPVGNSGSESRCRGVFKATRQSQSGDVGALEEESINLSLQVPISPTTFLVPFRWSHPSGTTLSQALQIALSAWENETTIDAQYLPDGSTGSAASVLVSEASITGGLDVMNEFSLSLQISGDSTAVT